MNRFAYFFLASVTHLIITVASFFVLVNAALSHSQSGIFWSFEWVLEKVFLIMMQPGWLLSGNDPPEAFWWVFNSVFWGYCGTSLVLVIKRRGVEKR